MIGQLHKVMTIFTILIFSYIIELHDNMDKHIL